MRAFENAGVRSLSYIIPAVRVAVKQGYRKNTPRQTAGRAVRYGGILLLDQLDSEAAEIFLQVDGDGFSRVYFGRPGHTLAPKQGGMHMRKLICLFLAASLLAVPVSLQKIQPPVPTVPSRLGQEKPPSMLSL